jgi:hypothetical protein
MPNRNFRPQAQRLPSDIAIAHANYRTMISGGRTTTSGGRTTTSGGRTTTAGGPTMNSS